MNLIDQALTPFKEKVSLIFLTSACFIREDHVVQFVRQAFDF